MGKGTGDLYIKANCGIIFTEIYVQDYLKYGLTTSDTWHNIKSPNVGNVSNGEFTGYNKMLDCDLDWSKDWSIEADYKQSAYRVGLIICDESMTTSYDTERYAILLNMSSNPKAQVEYKNSSDTLVYSVAGSTTLSFNTYNSLKFVKQGTTISVYVNDVLLDSRTNVDAINTANIGVYSWDSKNGYLKNLKIKPL